MGKRILEYVDFERKLILNRNAIINIWNKNKSIGRESVTDYWALVAIAQMSEEGAQFYKQIMEADYESLQRKNPSSYQAKTARRRVERYRSEGKDPFAFDEKAYNRQTVIALIFCALLFILVVYTW
jgi:hypothetical protein